MDLIDIDIKDKIYTIEHKIKVLNGKKQLILNGDTDIDISMADIESSIEALTNVLKML